MNREKEKGVALIVTLIVLAVLSAMTVSLLFLSQTETWSTMNYRLSSQARDGAEAGINAAANFLLNQNTAHPYALPATSGSDPISNYTLTTYPVTDGSGSQIILYGDSSLTSIYPYSTVISDYQSSGVGTGQIPLGALTVKYTTSAKLLAMRQATPYGSVTPTTVQTWLITSDGTVDIGVRSAKEELSMILERPIFPVFSYGAFGQAVGCGALTWSGGGKIDSYDSSDLSLGVATYGGNLGTNGNLSEVGGTTTVDGSLSTPRSGTGTCSAGNITADSLSGSTPPTGGIIELPQNIIYPTPTIPTNSLPVNTTNTNLNGGACPGGLVGCTYTHTGSGMSAVDNYVLDPCPVSGTPPATACTSTSSGYYGDLGVMNGPTILHLHGISGADAVYNVNQLSLSGTAQLVIDPIPGSSPPAYGPIFLDVCGASTGGTACASPTVSGLTNPVDLTGGTFTNSTKVPTNFQIQYAGTQNISLHGGSTSSGLVYAPNASVKLSGGSAWYGALLGNTVSVSGGTDLHYDRNLQNGAYTIAPWITQSFSWAKF